VNHLQSCLFPFFKSNLKSRSLSQVDTVGFAVIENEGTSEDLIEGLADMLGVFEGASVGFTDELGISVGSVQAAQHARLIVTLPQYLSRRLFTFDDCLVNHSQSCLFSLSKLKLKSGRLLQVDTVGSSYCAKTKKINHFETEHSKEINVIFSASISMKLRAAAQVIGEATLGFQFSAIWSNNGYVSRTRTYPNNHDHWSLESER